MPNLQDINVRQRDENKFEVSSHLTRGRCATVYRQKDDTMIIIHALTKQYREGISDELIVEAVRDHMALSRSETPSFP